ISAHFHDLMDRLSHPPAGGGIDFQGLSFGGAFDSRFIRIGAAVLLVALAFEFYFSRYDFLFEDHGAYLLGVDYVADHIALPLQWLMIVAAIVAAVLVLVGEPNWRCFCCWFCRSAISFPDSSAV